MKCCSEGGVNEMLWLFRNQSHDPKKRLLSVEIVNVKIESEKAKWLGGEDGMD